MKAKVNQEVIWLQQRIQLLRTHLQQLKDSYALEKQAVRLLKERQALERQQLPIDKKKLNQLILVNQQAAQLALLFNDFLATRNSLFRRQGQEEQDLNQRIEHERTNSSK